MSELKNPANHTRGGGWQIWCNSMPLGRLGALPMGGSPAFFGRKPGRSPGGRVSSSLDPPFLGWETLWGLSFFFCLAPGPLFTFQRIPPTAGRAGGGGFGRQGRRYSAQKPSPCGGGGPASRVG